LSDVPQRLPDFFGFAILIKLRHSPPSAEKQKNISDQNEKKTFNEHTELLSIFLDRI